MKEGFDLLTSSVGSLSDGHSVSYMINIVENFTPMYTYYAFQHAENQMITVMDRTLGVDKFSTSAFLNASKKVVEL